MRCQQQHANLADALTQHGAQSECCLLLEGRVGGISDCERLAAHHSHSSAGCAGSMRQPAYIGIYDRPPCLFLEGLRRDIQLTPIGHPILAPTIAHLLLALKATWPAIPCRCLPTLCCDAGTSQP